MGTVEIRSLYHSRSHALPHNLTPSLPPSLTHTLPPSLTPALPHSLTPSLTDTLVEPPAAAGLTRARPGARLSDPLDDVDDDAKDAG